jgi:hypothetical protein
LVDHRVRETKPENARQTNLPLGPVSQPAHLHVAASQIAQARLKAGKRGPSRREAI